MKKIVGFMMIFMLMSTVLFTGCKKDDVDKKGDLLKVKFINNASSEYTITSIRVQSMGPVDDEANPTGIWSENLLGVGETIAPGNFQLFDLEIPNGYWSICRLGVDDGAGNEILLHEQVGYTGFELSITHWGGDDRTVEATIVYSSYSDYITVQSWMDHVGID